MIRYEWFGRYPVVFSVESLDIYRYKINQFRNLQLKLSVFPDDSN